MIRKIVKIDETKCNGCGLCVTACQEGALQLVDGKARLLSDSYCDGLGACLPDCPTGAITVEEREAQQFDEAAVETHLARQKTQSAPSAIQSGCPGHNARLITPAPAAAAKESSTAAASQLRQWPCQIQLVPVTAPYFDNANLLIAADCTAYAYANVHADFMRDKITLIGCPKLDHADYAGKLAEILCLHDLKSITVLRMEVPCCGGLVNAVKEGLRQSGKIIPWQVVTIGTDGRIVAG
ncbi:Hypothetical protein LUCI_0380 [Lucifera butyrica]|uniref:4Fe-4S ferredoxin-type domain-containing protein n=1 Tax=Lucifera butyrica TaxID=1351585 RepID=A0A498R4R6_9FIRM|nr:4Fe-4S binding protein [Lucifera butyrica]VBB05173.1 Hypothetical protein LUCI_0380 [Lucifera butyrica]